MHEGERHHCSAAICSVCFVQHNETFLLPVVRANPELEFPYFAEASGIGRRWQRLGPAYRPLGGRVIRGIATATLQLQVDDIATRDLHYREYRFRLTLHVRWLDDVALDFVSNESAICVEPRLCGSLRGLLRQQFA